MMEVSKQVKINLPLLDAIKQVPAYAKFLKDLCTQKRRTRANTLKKVFLTEQVSSILQHSLPPKFKDPGAPTISCIIGDHKIDKTLLDLGAGVNLLPYSVSHTNYLAIGWSIHQETMGNHRGCYYQSQPLLFPRGLHCS